ncbi:trigger factor [Zongyangia hominis]|uniref:Trigger factor n=1 Tax=Zongyangia hominis TaxID=2763677 RepID=A0A926I9V0_9FIRM|nr:trigger factor [Zongyangia hominis]MBC8569551.1 trigger factor [Zongyangia hominis]
MSLTSAKQVETNKYELEIAVDGETFGAAVDKAYHKNGKKMQVPGFRKGKAPRSVIERMYGEGIFFEDAINDLYPAAYEAAVKEAKIEPVDRADVEIMDVSKDGFTFKATVTVKPEVEVENYQGIEATKKIVTVSDEEIEDEIQRLRERNGRMVNVEDRAAQDGDNTIIDFEGFVDDVAFEGGKGENYPLTLGSNQFIPGFEGQIVGHNVGDEFDVNVSFPEEYHVPELAGKPAVFKVKLHEIKMRELPEVDDEFAKDVSEFDTVAELKEDLKKKLQEAKENSAQNDLENQLIDVVIQNMKAEIPQVMIDNRIDEMVRDFDYRLQSQGMNLQTYLQYTGMEMDSFKKTFAEQAERQVKVRLALEKIVEKEAIEVEQSAVDEELKKLAEQYQIEVEKVKMVIPEEEVKKDLAVNKAIDLIRDTAKVTEVAEEAKKEEAKEKKPAKKTTKKAPAKKAAPKAEEPAEEAKAEEKE